MFVNDRNALSIFPKKVETLKRTLVPCGQIIVSTRMGWDGMGNSLDGRHS